MTDPVAPSAAKESAAANDAAKAANRRPPADPSEGSAVRLEGHTATTGGPTLASRVDAGVRRKLRAGRIGTPVVWSGLGMMGMVGWSVVVPTLAGALLGIWLDKHHPGGHSWTLALLVGGLVLGCFNAGFWVAKEERAMRDEQGAADG